jgi:hypothetical protein
VPVGARWRFPMAKEYKEHVLYFWPFCTAKMDVGNFRSDRTNILSSYTGITDAVVITPPIFLSSAALLLL